MTRRAATPADDGTVVPLGQPVGARPPVIVDGKVLPMAGGKGAGKKGRPGADGDVGTAAAGNVGAESSRKLLLLLLSFTEDNHTQTVGEMAVFLDAPASTIYRYVGLLRELGLLEEADRGRYRISLRAVGLARAARAAAGGLATIARPYLDALAQETGESALLFRRLGHAVVAVDLTESPHPVRLRFERGALMSLHQGAAGRILLAALSPAKRQGYYTAARQTMGLVPTPSETELATIASQGWTESFGQVEEGIWGTAAAIRDRRGVVAALGVAGPLYRLDDVKRAEIIAVTRRFADAINDAMSGPESD